MNPEDLLQLVKGYPHFYLHAIDWPHAVAEEAALRLYYDGYLGCHTKVKHDGRCLYSSSKYVPAPLASVYGVTRWEDRTAETVSTLDVDVEHLWFPTLEVQP